MLTALNAAGQQEQGTARTVGPYDPREDEPISETLDERARLEDFGRHKPSPPEIVPEGWLNDYDHHSSFSMYLGRKHREAHNSGKNVYIYLYADWLEACREFRKSVVGEDYAELFQNNQIIMLDYNLFKRKFDTRIRNLPMILKVNTNGMLGPESIHPVVNLTDHPKRAYYKIKKFFKSNS